MTDGNDELRAEIASTREDLGDTVAALVKKTDLKGRLKDRVRGWGSALVRTVRRRAKD